MPYIGVSPQFGVRRKHTYTATAGQTIFTGAGSEGATLSYKDSNFVDVYQNGVKLGDADYTSTSGTQIVLTQAASVDDLVEIIVFDAFSAADTVSKADGGTFDGNITMAGTLDVSGAFTSQGIDDNADATAITIDSSERVGVGDTAPLQPLHVKNSTFAYIRAETSASTKTGIDFGQHQDGSGHINLRDSGAIKISTGDTERMRIDANGHVTMPHQSAFLCQASGQTNLSTNATTTIGFSAIFDQNSDFDSSTETFTAPVTGKYQFNVFLRVDQVDNTSQYTTVRIETTNRTIYGIWTNNGYDADLDYITYGIAQLMDMDAGDTAKITIYLPSLGTAQLDVTDASFWSGYLVC